MDEHEHHTNLLDAHTRRLRALELQAAQLGQLTPPEIRIEIEDIQATLERLRDAGPSPERARLQERFASILFASASSAKHHEYCQLFGVTSLRWSHMLFTESQQPLLYRLAEEKLAQARRQLPHLAFFVEQAGLIIPAWQGLPGGLTGAFMQQTGPAGICRMMRSFTGSERAATASVVIGYLDAQGCSHIFSGDIRGTIAEQPRGDPAFGWDCIFVPEQHTRTFAEMTAREKQRLSMRRIAGQKLADHLLRSAA